LSFLLRIIRVFPPEMAHSFSLHFLKILNFFGLLKFFAPKQDNFGPIFFAGLEFNNRLGVAAGLDKNGDFIDALGSLGFGFIEVGTVTPKAQKGNAKPRVFRNYSENSIINRLGFNNKGVEYLLKNLKKRKYSGIVGVNVGANKSSTGNERINDYLNCIEKVIDYSDYITVNISSPNTPNLRDLHQKENLEVLIKAIDNQIHELEHSKPIFLKISPDESNENLNIIIELVSQSKITGLIATNTTIDKVNLTNKKFISIDGGLSGEPLMQKSTEKLSYIKSMSQDMPLIAVGGVISKEDYLKKLQSGASLVQIYTGFIIKGPNLVRRILQG